MGYQKPNRLMLASEGFPEHLLLLCSWKLLQSVEPQAADLVYGATGNKPYQNHLDLKRYSCILEIVGLDDSAIPRMKGPRFRLKNWNWVRSILSIFLHFLICVNPWMHHHHARGQLDVLPQGKKWRHKRAPQFITRRPPERFAQRTVLSSSTDVAGLGVQPRWSIMRIATLWKSLSTLKNIVLPDSGGMANPPHLPIKPLYSQSWCPLERKPLMGLEARTRHYKTVRLWANCSIYIYTLVYEHFATEIHNF